MTPHEEADALARLQTPAAHIAAFVRDAHHVVRRLGHSARGALVLGFVAPIVFRKPVKGATHPPEGWRVVMITNHLLEEMNGVWWAPDEAVPVLAAAWKYVTRPTGIDP